MYYRFRSFLSLFLVISLSGCATQFGSKTVPSGRFDYNNAINRSESEQLLLNLVRLRYRDAPTFLSVTSVVTQYSYSTSASTSSGISLTGGSSVLTPSISGAYEEEPTISYVPLAGRDFAQRLLTPVPPEALLLLSQEGWSIERLFLCCLDRINGIANATTATGPTPATIPNNTRVLEIASLMKLIQDSGALSFVLKNGKQFTAELHVDHAELQRENRTAEYQRFASLLGIDASAKVINITSTGFRGNNQSLDLKGRSLLGTLFALSHTVDVPERHVKDGLVTVSAPKPGAADTWEGVLGNKFNVRTSPSRPSNAFAAVSYRGHWYYIADQDLQSKSTFLLLRYLLALQSATAEGDRPLLTLTAGD